MIGSPLFLPNAWDYASAAALAQAGFTTIGTTSLGVALAAGLADGAGVARDATLAVARLVTRLPVRVSVDIEAGFSSSPDEVADLCAELAGLGVVGVNVEDGSGPADELVAKVRAVKARVPALFVNARTDVFWLGGTDLPTAVDRVLAYRAAGADGVFVPGLPGADIPAVAASVDAPLNVLYQPGGPPVPELFALGAGRVSTGSLLFRASLGTAVSVARAASGGADADDAVPSYDVVQRLVQ